MAAREVVAIYRETEEDVENSFVLLNDGKVYNVEEVLSQYLARLRPLDRIRTRVKFGNINATVELAMQGRERMADVFFEPDDVIAVVSMKRQKEDNNWLWNSATLRFSSQRGSIFHYKTDERDEKNYLLKKINTIYFIPEGDKEKKIVIFSETHTLPLAIISRAINKIIVEGRIKRGDLPKKLSSLKGTNDPPEAFPMEKLNEVEKLLRENGVEVYYDQCNLTLERYVNEIPVDEIKKIMSRGKRNVRLTVNFDPYADTRLSEDEIQKMQLYITLRNYSQYEDIVYYTSGRNVITAMNTLTDIALQHNYCLATLEAGPEWHLFKLVPCS